MSPTVQVQEENSQGSELRTTPREAEQQAHLPCPVVGLHSHLPLLLVIEGSTSSGLTSCCQTTDTDRGLTSQLHKALC